MGGGSYPPSLTGPEKKADKYPEMHRKASTTNSCATANLHHSTAEEPQQRQRPDHLGRLSTLSIHSCKNLDPLPPHHTRHTFPQLYIVEKNSTYASQCCVYPVLYNFALIIFKEILSVSLITIYIHISITQTCFFFQDSFLFGRWIYKDRRDTEIFHPLVNFPNGHNG